MLLNEFQKIQDIDKALNMLYEKHKDLLCSAKAIESETTVVDDFTHTENKVPKQIYNELAAKWQAHNINIPTYTKIEDRLEQAVEMIKLTTKLKPELYSRMIILLVPPTKNIDHLLAAESSEVSGSFKTSTEYRDAGLPEAKINRKWRVLVVYSEAEGLYIGTPNQLLSNKQYGFAGHSTITPYALGVHEYIAMILQEGEKIDQQSSTALLNNSSAGDSLVPIVNCIKGSYVFGVEESVCAFGDVRFRPAIEIK